MGSILAALFLVTQVNAQGAEPIAQAAQAHDIVILGEVHDNPAHHVTQAGIVALLDPSAIVFEMLDPSEAALLPATPPGDLADALDWANSGWPDFAFYAPLFEAASRRAAYGAEVPRGDAQAAFGAGAAAVFGPGAERFGLTTPLPADQQQAREAGQMAAHCDMLPADLLPGFVEAQRLRDAVLADAALRALADTGGPVVVITGNGHARRDWGVPAAIAQADPQLRVFALGQVEDGPPRDMAQDVVQFDMVVSAPPVDRPDPCAAFR